MVSRQKKQATNMSALGQKQTFAVQEGMSALPKADALFGKEVVEPAKDCPSDISINQGVNRPITTETTPVPR